MTTPRQTKKRSAPSKASVEASVEVSVPLGDAADTCDERSPVAPFPIVGVGASAGGLEAFTQLLKALPLDTGMGFVLVQHLDPEHESALTQILARATSLPVHEVTNNQAVQANHVYVIPPDTNLSIAKGVLKLQPRERSRMPHRPIDSFFESLSQDQRERAIGVVLSGTASDGTLGLEAIKAEGGITFAQDDSAKYDSMPRSAVGAGCVDLVLSPADIAKELARIAKHPYVAGQLFELATRAEGDRAEATKHGDDDTPLPSGGRGTPPTQSKQVHAEADGEGAAAKGTSVALEGFRKVVLLLRSHSGVDFSLYKSNTIQRRITRRLVLSKLETLNDYAGFLRGNAKELDALYSDVLISVTSFFRNPEMFDVLQREVFPKLLEQPGDQPIRVWVLGCSTGQEAYSIAMTFLESAEKMSRLRKLQVFATDLNDTLLDKARNGLYAKSLADDITPERLRRFFIEEQGGYRVCKMLREMVVFARQNLIADTPFSRMDLVSCRNLLIYLEPSLQKKAMPTFHYALKPGGFLLLGASESIGGFTDLFEPVDKKYKIYSKKPAAPLAIQLPVRGERDEYGAPSRRPLLPPHQPGVSEPPEGFRSEHNNVQREADRITISQFAPPGVVVNAELQILQFRGPTGAYLEPPIGKASLDVLKMAREGLMLPLRSAINEAKKQNKSARKENVRIKQDGKTRTVSLDVIPLKNMSESCFLILFHDAEKAGRAALATQANRSASAPGLTDDAAETGGLRSPARQKTGARQKTASRDETASRIADLETDLSETREYLQSIQEQHEAANEELQAASEEVQSSNEELQSINEELETSKEELESSNEELTTVNEEMSNRNVELDRVNNDLVNLQTSTKLAIVLLGRDLTIRRFSPQAEKQFDVLATDVGRPIRHIRHKLVFADAEKSPVDLEVLAAAVMADVREQEHEVRDNADRWHLLRVRPYMTLDNKVDGAVLVLVEIEALKRSEQIAIVARNYAENTLETVREPMLVLDRDLRVESANRSFYRTFRVAPAETVGTFVYELGNRQWNIPRLRELLQEALSLSQNVEDFEVEHDFEQLGRRIMLLNARRIIDPLQNSERILLAIEDITERRQAEVEVKESDGKFRSLLESAPDAIVIVDQQGTIVLANALTERLFGYSRAEMLGQRVEMLMPTRFHNRHDVHREGYFANSRSRGMGGGMELLGKRKDGSEFPIDVSLSPLETDQGTLVSSSIRDITERKQLEVSLQASETLYRRLFETAKDGVLILDASNGKILDANPFMTELSGYSTVEFIGKELWEIGLFRDKSANEDSLRELQQKGYVRYDYLPLKSKGNPPVEVEFVSNVYQWDHRHVAQCNIRDISDRSRLEKQTKKQASELSDLHRRKDEFLAMLSHELRSPLAPISNALQLMELQQGSENLIQQQARRIIGRQLSQLQHLVDDLLEVSRITTGRVQLRRVLVAASDIVGRAVETAQPVIEQRRHALTVSLPAEPIWLHADAARLEQVLVNLLSNAAKYTDEGGQVWLTVQQEGDECVLRVRDLGVGIAPDLLPHVFDLFTQAERSLDRSQGGLGIGLALVLRLTELHGGKVEAFSDLGQGSEFVVRLPVAPTDAPQSTLSVSETGKPITRSLRVLVVDDNVDTVLSFTMLLRALGHDVQTAHDGPTAVKAAIDYRPDVMLLDIGLPGLNGYEVAKRIRQQPDLKNIVLVALTGYGQEADRQTSLQAGFNQHLVKPARFDQLQQILANVSRQVT